MLYQQSSFLAVARDWRRIMSIIKVLFVAAAVCLPLAACGGGGAKTETSVTNTTVSKGQRLIDLKAALDAGAITQQEYQKERQKILDE